MVGAWKAGVISKYETHLMGHSYHGRVQVHTTPNLCESSYLKLNLSKKIQCIFEAQKSFGIRKD